MILALTNTTGHSVTPLHTLWLTETVRLREEHAGNLEDLEANRLARAAGGDLPTRIQQRALHLAERDGLTVALTRWLQGARLALVLLAVVAVISDAGLAFDALGNGLTPVNVFWALGSLLGYCLLFGILLNYLRNRTGLAPDTLIGVFLSVSLALGASLLLIRRKIGRAHV